MITQILNKKVTYIVLTLVILHSIGLAMYLYNFIPDDYQQIFFFNLDRFYVMSILVVGIYIFVDKAIKICFATSLAIYTHYTIAVNLRFIFDISDGENELNWLIYFCVTTLLILLNILYYGRKRMA